MKTRYLIKLVTLAVLLLSGTATHAAEAPARLLYNDGSHDDVLIISYKNGSATYRLNARALNLVKVGAPRLESIYFYEPAIFAEAMTLYRSRSYAEAKIKFAECQEAFKKVDTAPNNYATLAGFYVMECSRRMNDLSALSSELEKYRKEGLTRETHLQQIEVYAFWEAVRLKDWERLERLAQAWHKRKVPVSQRAQIEYCRGLALENIAKNDPDKMLAAINAYNKVLSADFTASSELVVLAANNVLRIYANDPKVKLAMRLWKSEDENPNSSGYQRLIEANTMVKLYKQAGLDAVKPLVPEYAKFSKYEAAKADDGAAPTEESEPTADSEEPKKAEKAEKAEKEKPKEGKEKAKEEGDGKKGE